MFSGSIDDLGVIQGTVAMKETVLQHQWDLELTLRKVQRLLCFVAYEVEASKPGEDVEPGDT